MRNTGTNASTGSMMEGDTSFVTIMNGNATEHNAISSNAMTSNMPNCGVSSGNVLNDNVLKDGILNSNGLNGSGTNGDSTPLGVADRTKKDVTVECRNLDYRYGKHEVFSDVSFSLTPGVTGLLGVNGAGKTTLLTILATLRTPKSGRAFLLGNDVATVQGKKHIRRSLGYLPQTFEVMGYSTVADNVAYAAWAHGVSADGTGPATEWALRAVGLGDKASARARTLSGGQRQRLGIACAIAHKPSVVLLDEPTAGVDPLQRVHLREVIASIGKQSTVVLSTHLVDDVARIADNLLILMDGGLAYAGSPRVLAGAGAGVGANAGADAGADFDSDASGIDIAHGIEAMMAGEW